MRGSKITPALQNRPVRFQNLSVKGGSTFSTINVNSSASFSTINVSGGITVSGSINISGSEDLTVNDITASGNVSGSGTGSFAHIQLPGQGKIAFDDTSPSDQFITGYDNLIQIDADQQLDLLARTHVKDNTPLVISRVNGTIYDLTGSMNITSSAPGGLNASLNVEGPITASGDLSIKGFPSVSASLAAAGSGGGTTPTLQQVTDQGSSTTTPITASIISASGQIIGDVVDTSFETFLNFEAATSYTYIAPFPLAVNFTGSSTSSMEVVGFVTASANTDTFSTQQSLPITLNRFDKLKITPSSSGLFTFSGSRTI